MRARRGHYLVGVLTAVVAVLISLALLRPDSGPSFWFGTLQTDPAMARTEHEHGVRVAHLAIHWDRFEPVKGSYDAKYIAGVKNDLRALRESGLRVEASMGVNHPPAWLYKEHPEAAFVNEFGDRYTGTANIVFSQAVRDEAARYVMRVDEQIGLENFWAIRVGVSETGEFSYPPPVAGRGGRGGYWAFDTNAQERATAPGRPATTPRNPFPGWRPGNRTFAGKPFSPPQVSQWYDWYLAALADAVNWQISQYRALGYEGSLKVLIPGSGYYPADHTAAVGSYLDGPVERGLISRGVGFFKTMGEIVRRGHVEMVSTAVVDGSGIPRNNGCRPGDSTVAIRSLDDGTVRRWSSVRWVSALAKRHGFPLSGESAGPQVAPYYPGVMDEAARQMKSCGLRGLMWAFDGQLYDGTPGSSLQEYTDVIDRYT